MSATHTWTHGLETLCFRIPSELPLQTGEQALQWDMGISWRESAFHNIDALLERCVSAHSPLEDIGKSSLWGCSKPSPLKCPSVQTAVRREVHLLQVFCPSQGKWLLEICIWLTLCLSSRHKVGILSEFNLNPKFVMYAERHEWAQCPGVFSM